MTARSVKAATCLHEWQQGPVLWCVKCGSERPGPIEPGEVRLGDVRQALDLLSAIRAGREGDDDFLAAFVHLGEPASKARARFTRAGHAYTPSKTLTAQNALSVEFAKVMDGRTLTGNVAIAAIFHRRSHQRIDADNLMKLVLDAGTKAKVWHDDSQVTAQCSLVELDPERPRTVIALSNHASTMQRGTNWTRKCPTCQLDFVVEAAYGRKTYCSQKCAETKLGDARCPKCETSFPRRRAAQRYCSAKCRDGDRLVRQKADKQRPPATCTSCGGRVSRREYVMCAPCRGIGRPVGSKNRTSA